MILNTFLQLINQEIQLMSHIVLNTLIKTMDIQTPIGGISTITGTAGTTITTGTTDTMDGTNLIFIGIIAALFIIGHLIDRHLNQKTESELTALEEEHNQD